MTHRTSLSYVCPLGHRGIVVEALPASVEGWALRRVEGMKFMQTDSLGMPVYLCNVCGKWMRIAEPGAPG